MTEKQLIAEYRRANRKKRDEMWFMYLGMRLDFQKVEDSARRKCAECGFNPHTVYCSRHRAD